MRPLHRCKTISTVSPFVTISDRTDAKTKTTTTARRENVGGKIEDQKANITTALSHECPGVRPAGAENLTEFSNRTRRRATQISPYAFPPTPLHPAFPLFASPAWKPPALPLSLSLSPLLSRVSCYPPITYKPPCNSAVCVGGWTSAGWHFGTREDTMPRSVDPVVSE